MAGEEHTEVAKVYLQVGTALFRFKVFKNFVGIERQQPSGPNCLLPKDFSPHTMLLYNEQLTAWNLDAIAHLLEDYPYSDYYQEPE